MSNLKKNVVITSLLAFLFLSSCASTSFYKYSSNNEQVKYYVTQKPASYNEIGFVEVWGNIFSSKKHMYQKLEAKAKSLGGNGVINVIYTPKYWYPTLQATVISVD